MKLIEAQVENFKCVEDSKRCGSMTPGLRLGTSVASSGPVRPAFTSGRSTHTWESPSCGSCGSSGKRRPG